ncbi:sigma-54-dependent Fis family transcriptional regulator [Anaeroselena agilis]|uniref:Sigma 54-interacting transcriptional regulator n=1 Tax=Anaeroselena agilis TaxID=3063788 RepID=A0ABU3NXY1_9FIRM|nr:sigma 54-interacting transcriptional regulator [Selenomonadales bacterium 4137-cl]
MIQDELIRVAWERFINHRQIEAGSIRTEIVRSWLRCEQQGVDYRSGGSSVIVNGKELEALLARNAEIIDASRPFMHNLYELMKNSGFAVILVDRDGFVIEVIGDSVVLESHRGIQYVNGVKWTEDLVGTTAISLVLLGSGPIQVSGYEHYCQKHQDWACSAAPLTDAAGNLLGVLSVTGRTENVHCHTLGMVVSAAAAINNYLAVKKTQQELEQTASIHSTIVNKVSDGLLMIDAKGIVTFVNPTGAKILNINAAEALGKHISTLVDFRPVVLRVLETGQGYTDKEFVIETKRGILHFIKSAIPLKNSKGELEGVIDIFREIKRIRQLVTKMVGATAQFSFEDIVGNSPAMKECVRLAKIAANSAATVLIQGESGTGKELIAQAIHNASLRSEGPFIAINCGALPRNLVESELFGYEDGAFTGAKQGGRPGKFELAHGGTIFLDEIGEMPLDIQVKLLRVLQEKRITRVGGHRSLEIDVRVIAATNRDVADEVKEGNFRHDLYYRLNVLPIYVPPLRERLEDIPPLIDYLLKKMCHQLDVDDKHFSDDALARIMAHEWPGNVRELENVVERAVNICENIEIGSDYLPRTVGEKSETTGWSQLSLRDAEKKIIKETLHNTRGNISHAAKLLGIGRNTLYSKLRDYAITVPKENEMFTN